MYPPLAAQKTSEKALFGNAEEIARLEEVFRNHYGPDQKLYSGVVYFNLDPYSLGHKFLGVDEYQPGSMLFDNQRYEDVRLKYDIFNQQLLLLSGQEGKRPLEIIVNDMGLQEFSLGERVFRKSGLPGEDTLIYEVFEGERLTFLYHWYKVEIPRVRDTRQTSEFSEVKHRSFINMPSGIQRFTGARSLAKLFPGQGPELRKFMRRESIRPGSAGDREISELLKYCDRISFQAAGDR
jgi:hypothetical protein